MSLNSALKSTGGRSSNNIWPVATLSYYAWLRGQALVKFSKNGFQNNFREVSNFNHYKKFNIGLSNSAWAFIVYLLRNQKISTFKKTETMYNYKMALTCYQKILKMVYFGTSTVRATSSNTKCIVRGLLEHNSNSSVLDKFVYPKLKKFPKGGEFSISKKYKLTLEKLVLTSSLYRTLYFSRKYSSKLAKNLRVLKKLRNYLSLLFHSVSSKTINFYPYGGAPSQRHLLDTRSFSKKRGFQNFKIPVSVSENLNNNNIFYDRSFQIVNQKNVFEAPHGKKNNIEFLGNTFIPPNTSNRLSPRLRYTTTDWLQSTNKVYGSSTNSINSIPHNHHITPLNLNYNKLKTSKRKPLWPVKTLRLLAYSVAINSLITYKVISHRRYVKRLTARNIKHITNRQIKYRTNLYNTWVRTLFLLKKYYNYRTSTASIAWKIRLSPREISDKTLNTTLSFKLFKKFLIAFAIPKRIKKYFINRERRFVKSKIKNRRKLFKFASNLPSTVKFRLYNKLPSNRIRKNFKTIRKFGYFVKQNYKNQSAKSRILLVRSIPETISWYNLSIIKKIRVRGRKASARKLVRPIKYFYKKNILSRKVIKRSMSAIRGNLNTANIILFGRNKNNKTCTYAKHVDNQKRHTGANLTLYSYLIGSSLRHGSQYRSVSRKICLKKLKYRNSFPFYRFLSPNRPIKSKKVKTYFFKHKNNRTYYKYKYRALMKSARLDLSYRPLSAYKFLSPFNFEFMSFTDDYAKRIRLLGGKLRIISTMPHKFIDRYSLRRDDNIINTPTSKVDYLFNRSKGYVNLIKNRRKSIKWNFSRLSFYMRNKNYILQNWITKTMIYHNQGFLKKKKILKRRVSLVLNNRPNISSPFFLVDPVVGSYWGPSFASCINKKYRKTTMQSVNFGIDRYVVWKYISKYYFSEKNNRAFGSKRVKMPRNVANEDFASVKRSVLKIRYLLKNEIKVLREGFRNSTLKYFYPKTKRLTYSGGNVPYVYQIPNYGFSSRRFLQNGKRKLPFYWIRTRKKKFPLKNQKKNWVWSIGFWASDERFHRESTTLYEGSVAYNTGKFYAPFYNVVKKFSIDREMSLMLRFRNNKPFIFIPYILRTQKQIRKSFKYSLALSGLKVFGLLQSSMLYKSQHWVPRNAFKTIFGSALYSRRSILNRKNSLKFLQKVQIASHSLLSLNLAFGRLFRTLGTISNTSPMYVRAESTTLSNSQNSYKVISDRVFMLSNIKTTFFSKHFHKTLLASYATCLSKPLSNMKIVSKNDGPLGTIGAALLRLRMQSKSSLISPVTSLTPLVYDTVLGVKLLNLRSRAVSPTSGLYVFRKHILLGCNLPFKNKIINVTTNRLLFSNKTIRVLSSKKLIQPLNVW